MANKFKNNKSPKKYKAYKSKSLKSISRTTNQQNINPRVKKIIQGGGGNYYDTNSFNNHSFHQEGAGNYSNLGSNILLVLIIILLAIISYLLYINYIAKNAQNIKQIELDINNVLLQEANNIKKHKILNNKTNNSDKTDEHFSDSIDDNMTHSQYNLGHRFVGPDANNPQSESLFVPVLNHAMERIINPLLPPERSYVNTYGIPTNIPSRGFTGGYQQVGSLHKTEVTDTNAEPGNNNKSVILPLFGQPTYPGSNKWNYYTTTDKHAMVKVIFKVGNKDSDDRHGVNELMTGDKIQIPEYNGNFDVKIYQFDQPRYIPYIY